MTPVEPKANPSETNSSKIIKRGKKNMAKEMTRKSKIDLMIEFSGLKYNDRQMRKLYRTNKARVDECYKFFVKRGMQKIDAQFVLDCMCN